MAWTFFHSFKKFQIDGTGANTPIDFDTHDIRIALITSATAPVVATHDFWNDLQSNEVSGDNYTIGGTALANKTVTLSSGVVTFDADDVTFLQHASGFANARYAVLYRFNATAADAPLICFEDLGGDKGNQSGDLTLQMHANGIFTLT